MDSSNREPPDDVARLRREIEALRERLGRTAEKSKQLSWDTDLLVKKTQNLKQSNKVSCADPNWQQILDNMEVGPEGIWIADVRKVEDIAFVADFSARHQLTMTYGNRSFHLEPRQNSDE